MDVPPADFLIVRREGQIDTQVPLDRLMMRIGRSDQCDIVLEDPDKSISRFHALLQKNTDKEEFRIKNDEGKTGTLINQKSAGDWTVLKRGDVISIGPYNLIYSYGGQVDFTDSDATIIQAPNAVNQAVEQEAQNSLIETTLQSPKELQATDPSGKVRLQFIEGPFAGGEQVLNSTNFVIGRDADNEVWLNDQTRTVLKQRISNRPSSTSGVI